MSTATRLDAQIHHHIVRGLIDEGRAPGLVALSELVGAGMEAIVAALRHLEANHGIVCHPGTTDPWVVHPFSLTPTATWVQGSRCGWWAPCIWCALGIARLVRENVVIHTRIGGEAEDLDIHVDGGAVRERTLLVHFAVPLRAAWNNVHHTCATVLPFETEPDVDAWSERHAIAKGAVVPIDQVAELARIWYGRHGDADWEKWSIAQTSAIFSGVGLRGDFWRLEGDAGGRSF